MMMNSLMLFHPRTKRGFISIQEETRKGTSMVRLDACKDSIILRKDMQKIKKKRKERKKP